MINKEKKLLKKYLKRKINITTSLIIGFLITGIVSLGTPIEPNANGGVILNNGTVTGINAIVGGTTNNKASGETSVALGGTKNVASGKASVVIGGGFYERGDVVGNTAAGLNSSIIGGVENSISEEGSRSSVIGGYKNSVSKKSSSILGGEENTISADKASIIGGWNNKVLAERGFIVTGGDNQILTGGIRSAIIGGYTNKISSEDSTIIGGYDNKISSSNSSTIIGGNNNKIENSEVTNAIFAGQNNTIENVNKSNIIIGGAESKIGGTTGYDNLILGGGDRNYGGNEITNGDNDIIIGGYANKIASDGTYQDNNVILGGHHNKIEINTKDGFIIGGAESIVNGSLSGVLGGVGNNITGNGSYVIGGSNPNTGKKSVDKTYGNTVSGNNSFVIGGKNTISGNLSYAFGNNNKINQSNVYILGSNVDASGVANAVVLGDNSTAVANAISIGSSGRERNIKHVKDGEISDTSFDAINGSQVTTIEKEDKSPITVTADTTITDHKNFKIGLKVDKNTIKINKKGELYADVTDTDTNSIETVKATDDGITVNGGTEAKDKIWKIGLSDKTKKTLKQVDKNTTAIASNTTKIDENATAIAGNTTKINENKTAINNNTTKINKIKTEVAEKINTADMNKSITGKGIKVDGNGANKLLGKITLEIEDDAITTSKIKNKNVTKDKLADNVQNTLTQVEDNEKNITKNSAAIENMEISYKTPNSTKRKVKLSDGFIFGGDKNISIETKDKGEVNYKLNSELKEISSVENGKTKISLDKNKNEVNVNGAKITNVKAGEKDTDAVNVAQLKAANKATGNNRNAVMRNARDIEKVGGELKRGLATAAALAGLKPMQFDPLQKNQVMAAIGSYKDKQAVAVGLNHYFNENLMMNAGISLGEGKRVESLANIGITWKIGNDDRDEYPERYEEGPIASVYIMQNEIEGLLKENSKQKNQLKNQAEEIKIMKKQIQMLLKNK